MSTYRKMARRPTTPGEILHEEFLKPFGMSREELADHLGCDVKVVNRIVNGRTSVTAEMALKAWRRLSHIAGLLAQRAEGGGSSSGPSRRTRPAPAIACGDLTPHTVTPAAGSECGWARVRNSQA